MQRDLFDQSFGFTSKIKGAKWYVNKIGKATLNIVNWDDVGQLT